MNTALLPDADARLRQIALARQGLLAGDAQLPLAPWIEQSWRRCLSQGRQPRESLGFDVVPAQSLRRAREAHHALIEAASPVMAGLARAVAGNRYFALLTDARGIVVAAEGAIDAGDRRASVIARVGVDLSEAAVGTTAIGAALGELQPVWLHRGEHFFDDTACYSCAGAPVFGPDGECAGMLDLTGIDAAERPQLRHLVAQAARCIENALVLRRPHALVLRLNWPGQGLGGEDDGLVALDAEGGIVGCNRAAREIAGPLPDGPAHAADVFAMPWPALFDAARQQLPRECPLWNGLSVRLQAHRPGQAAAAVPLRDVESALIDQALRDARGNVMEAARRLGISRATLYRRLGRERPAAGRTSAKR